MANTLILDFLGTFIDSYTIFSNLQALDEDTSSAAICLSLPELLSNSGYNRRGSKDSQLR